MRKCYYSLTKSCLSMLDNFFFFVILKKASKGDIFFVLLLFHVDLLNSLWQLVSFFLPFCTFRFWSVNCSFVSYFLLLFLSFLLILTRLWYFFLFFRSVCFSESYHLMVFLFSLAMFAANILERGNRRIESRVLKKSQTAFQLWKYNVSSAF